MESGPKPGNASDSAMHAEARRYVRRLRKFYSLLGVSVLVIALTATINLIRSPGHWWFLWVVLGMGIAVAFSAFDLFVKHRVFGADWEGRQIAKRIEKYRG